MIALTFFVSLELTYNVRRVIATGIVFPRFGVFFLLASVGLYFTYSFLPSQGHSTSVFVSFAIGGIPGLLAGMSTDPHQ